MIYGASLCHIWVRLSVAVTTDPNKQHDFQMIEAVIMKEADGQKLKKVSLHGDAAMSRVSTNQDIKQERICLGVGNKVGIKCASKSVLNLLFDRQRRKERR